MDFLYIALIAIVLVYLRSVSSRLRVLEKRLQKLSVPSTEHAPAMPSQVPQQSSEYLTPQTTFAGGVLPMMSRPEQSQKPVEHADTLHTDLGSISATQWITGIGIVALLFGIGFFLKYAIDQNWISVWGRIILGLAVGGLFVVLGELWQRKYPKYAQSLTGGGIAILYFSIFASYQFYHLWSQQVAFFCMILVTILGITLAFRYVSKPLSILALVGGFLTPILVSSGQNAQVALFMYLTLLNCAILLILYKRFWWELLYVLLIGSCLDFALWAGQYSTAENLLTSVAFLIFNYLIVSLSISLLFRRAIETNTEQKNTEDGLAAFHVLAGFATVGAMIFLLDSKYHEYLAPLSLLFGVIMFISYAMVDRLEKKTLNYAQSLVGAGFIVLACLWQFHEQVLAAYLLLLGVIGVVVGLVQKRRELRTWGLVITLGGIITSLVVDYDYAAYAFLFNAKFAVAMLSVVAAICIESMYERFAVDEDEKPAANLFRVVAAFVFWLAGTLEISAYFRSFESQNTKNLLLSVWWMAYAVVLMVVSLVKRYAVLRKVSVALFALTILKVFLYDVSALDLGYRIVSFILLGIILLSVAFAYQKNKEKIQKFISN